MKKIIIALMVLFSFSANAEKVYLYVFFHDDNSTGERFRTEVESMTQCLDVISKSKMPMPTNPSGDYEVMGAMWCGGDMERNYSSTWFKDKKRDLEQESK